VIGTQAERPDTIRTARVPFRRFISGHACHGARSSSERCFGVAGAGHTAHQRAALRYAWPSGDWGSLPVEGGIEAAYRATTGCGARPRKLRHEIEQRLNRYRSPFRTAETFLVEDSSIRATPGAAVRVVNLTAKLRAAGPVATPMRP